MLILDTNVISELMRPQPSERVIAWLDLQHATSLYTTSINWAELLHGLELLPDGRRKQGLRQTLQAVHERMVGGRILAFDESAARRFAQLMTHAQSQGQSLGLADGQIAAIALERRMRVATRDVAPFLAVGVKVVNPWDALTA